MPLQPVQVGAVSHALSHRVLTCPLWGRCCLWYPLPFTLFYRLRKATQWSSAICLKSPVIKGLNWNINQGPLTQAPKAEQLKQACDNFWERRRSDGPWVDRSLDCSTRVTTCKALLHPRFPSDLSLLSSVPKGYPCLQRAWGGRAARRTWTRTNYLWIFYFKNSVLSFSLVKTQKLSVTLRNCYPKNKNKKAG